MRPRTGDPPAWPDEAQAPPRVDPPRRRPPAPLLFDSEHRPIASPEGWAVPPVRAGRRLADLPRRDRPRAGPRPAPTVVDRDRVAAEADGDRDVLRLLVRYEAEPGREVEAYLLRPEGPAADRSRPGAVVLHSTVDYTIRQPSGLEGPADKWIGLHLARRGYVCICPRCFLWE